MGQTLPMHGPKGPRDPKEKAVFCRGRVKYGKIKKLHRNVRRIADHGNHVSDNPSCKGAVQSRQQAGFQISGTFPEKPKSVVKNVRTRQLIVLNHCSIIKSAHFRPVLSREERT
jgi:hypothetical protein